MNRVADSNRLVAHLLLILLASLLFFAAPAEATIVPGSMFSPSNGRDVDYDVYLPPGYNSQASRRYPVVYSLHGEGGAPSRRAANYAPTLDQDISSGAIMPMIWVFPDGQDNSYYGNAFDGHKQVYSNIVSELVPLIDKTYKTFPDRRARAVEGFSMGGFGAGMLAATNTKLFSATVLEGAVVPTWDKLLVKQPEVALEMYNDVEANFLPYSLWDTTTANASAIAAKMDYKMDCGDHDGQLSNNLKFANYLISLGIDPQFQILPGVGHGGSMYIQNGAGVAFLNQHFLNEWQSARGGHAILTSRAVPEPSAWVLAVSVFLVLTGRRLLSSPNLPSEVGEIITGDS
jgi:enterochelin esterase-like enzyme